VVNNSDDRVLRLSRILPGPPPAVWRALTDPAALAAWFWPARLHPSVDTDVRVGGGYRLWADSMAVRGTYAAVDPPRRLVFTWQWEGDDEETLVSIELSACDGGTLLSLTHERFVDGTDRDNHGIGWTDCLDRLAPHLTVMSADSAVKSASSVMSADSAVKSASSVMSADSAVKSASSVMSADSAVSASSVMSADSAVKSASSVINEPA
jgi:uncharacterized protein YndB with AHSA1/START domain